MTGREFRVTTRQETGDRLVLEFHGDIDAGAQAGLEDAYRSPLAGEAQILVLDFEDVDYINSTGIALIVGLLANARTADQGVVAYGLSEHYRQIFQITRLSDFVGIYPDQVSALAAVRGA
jgi:anti-sigma B factor antagonist